MKITRIIGAALLGLILGLTHGASAQADGFIDYCENQDKSKAELYTLQLLAKLAGDASCAKIKAKLEEERSLKLDAPGLRDLKALAFFDHLTDITLKSSNPVRLAQLSGLTNLKHLIVTSPVESVDTLPPSLTVFQLYDAPGVKIAPLAGHGLVSLTLYRSPAESYQFLASFPNLSYLALGEAGLRSLADLPAMPELTGIDLTGNELASTKGIERFQKLGFVQVRRNPLTSFSELTKLPALDTLDLSDTQVKDFTVLPQLKVLSDLRLERLALTEVPKLGSAKFLRRLNLKHNNISDVSPLKDLLMLNILYLGYNKIDNVDALGNLPRLMTLELQGNQLRSIGKLTPNLYSLYLDRNHFTDLDWLKGLNVAKIRNLSLSHNRIRELTELKGFTKLRHLYFNYTEVTSLQGLASLEQLFRIEANHSKISDLTALADNASIEFAYLNHNQIEDVSVLAKRASIADIELEHNPLGTTIAKTEANCPTDRGPILVQSFCRK